MKIAIVGFRSFTFAAPAKGHEAVLGFLADALVARGHDVLFYGPSTFQTKAKLRSFESVALDDNMAFQIIPPEHRGFVYSIAALEYTSWAFADAERQGADVVHTHDAFAWPLQSHLKIPHVMTMHHMSDLPPEAISVLLACFPAFGRVEVVNVSHDQRKQYPEGRFRVVPHGIELSRFKADAKREDYLAFLGRVCENKGTHSAIEIARKSGLPLKIAGGFDPADPYFEERIRPELDDQIQYLGPIGFEAKNDLLGKARAMLFPIQWAEPFGMVLLESMACGAPVIAMRKGSTPEIVKDGVSGFLCDSVDEMIASVEKAKTLSPASVRDYAASRFSADRMAADYEKVYEDAVARFEPPSIP